MNTTLIPDVTLTFSPECCKEYTGMAFDGNYFFLTVPSELKICKFSLDFILCCFIDTCRPYTSISYDNKENCFWAWNEDSAETLFKLDREMKEISRIGLCPQDGSCPRITAVSYHRQTNTFLAAFTNTVAEFKKNGQFIHTLQEADNIQFSSVLSVLSCYATVCDSGGNQVIQFFTFQGRLVTSASLPAACRVIDIAFHTCPEPDRKAIILSILAAKPDHTICVPRCKIDVCDITPCKCPPKSEHKCSHKCECKHECKPKCDCRCKSPCCNHSCRCKDSCKCCLLYTSDAADD